MISLSEDQYSKYTECTKVEAGIERNHTINNSIITALKNLVTINLDNVEVATIISNEIKAKEYRIKNYKQVSKT